MSAEVVTDLPAESSEGNYYHSFLLVNVLVSLESISSVPKSHFIDATETFFFQLKVIT